MQAHKVKRFSVSLDKEDYQQLSGMAQNAQPGISLSLLVGCAVKEFINKYHGNKLGIKVDTVATEKRG
jgi:hypothetical protein